MTIPNPHVITAFIIEYLYIRRSTWNYKKKLELCMQINQKLYGADKQLAPQLKNFNGWPNLIFELGDYAREEAVNDCNSFLAETIHALRTYIIDKLTQPEECDVIFVPKNKTFQECIPKNVNATYIVSDKQLHYFNRKNEGHFEKVNIDEEKLKSFKEITKATEQTKTLNEEQWKAIKELNIDHTHGNSKNEFNNYLKEKIAEKDKLKERIAVLENEIINMMEANNSLPGVIARKEQELQNCLTDYKKELTNLVDLGHVNAICEAKLKGFFNPYQWKYPEEADICLGQGQGMIINASLPSVYQNKYHLLHYEKWYRTARSESFADCEKNATQSEVSLPQGRTPLVKNIRPTQTSSVGTFLTTMTSLASNYLPSSTTSPTTPGLGAKRN